MECSPAEIEKKRRLALAKLQAKKLLQTSPNILTNQNKNPHNLTSPKVSSPSNRLVFNGNQSPVSSKVPTKQVPTNIPNNNVQKCSPSIPSNTNSYYNPKMTTNNQSKPHNNTPYSKENTVSPQQFFGKTVTGTMTLISDSRFEVNLEGYSAKAIEIFRAIPTRNYNINKKNWDFDIKDYKLLLSKMQMLRPEVVIGEIPQFVLRAINEAKYYNEDIDLSCIDPELGNALLPFQRDGVIYGINHNGRVLIADDMGLGKTFQALAIACYYKKDWPLLIGTTASMRQTWQETIQKYMPSIPLMSVQYMVSAKDYIHDARVLIVSRDMISRCIERLLEKKFGVMILDESHEFKNFKTKAAQCATQLAKIAKRVILLSGTPALSRPNELFTQLSLIDEKFFGNFFEYSKRYCDGKQTNFGWDSSGKSNLTELEIILPKKFMIRRTKDDVLKSLPSKTREIIKLDLSLSEISEDEMKCLEHLIKNYNAQKKGVDKHSALLSLFSETANLKIPSVCSYILKTLQENVKFLVFAHHQKMLDAIGQVLTNSGVDFMRIDGNTTIDQRKFFVDKFQNKETCRAAVLSITAANSGITLTAAQLVLFAELHWNPSILSQAESRAHRIGQQNEVQIRYLLAEGTSDDYIWPMLLEKQNVLGEVGLTNDSFKDITVLVQKKTEDKPKENLLQSWLTKTEDKTSDNNIPSLLLDDNDDLFNEIQFSQM